MISHANLGGAWRPHAGIMHKPWSGWQLKISLPRNFADWTPGRKITSLGDAGLIMQVPKGAWSFVGDRHPTISA